MSDGGSANGMVLEGTSPVRDRRAADVERIERRGVRWSTVPLPLSALLVGATATVSPTSPSHVVLLGVAGASMLATAIVLAIDRGRDGFSVLVEATLASGLLMLVADATGVELVTGGGMGPALRVTSLATSILAVAAFASLASLASDRARPGALVLASSLAAIASVTANVEVPWLRTPTTATRGSLVAACILLAGVACLDMRSAAAGPRLYRPIRASFGRLTLVVASVLAGPVALAAVTAGRTTRDAVAGAALPLAALAALGVAHLARLLDQRVHLEHLALHDELTGLPNRALFIDHLQQTIAASDHMRTDTAVLFVDVDRFKKVNDSLGHPAGDELLRNVATRLRLHLRDGDTVARLGGDEFGVVLAACDDEQAVRVAERMLEELATPITVMGHEVFVGASIGIAIGPRDGHDALGLLKNADAAMYSAKAQGRARLARYRPELNSTAEARLELETELHRALAANTDLVVHYQPKVDLDTGTIVGAEALVRWHHPTRGLLLPAEFIPMAEDTGLIGALGEWVLLRTCAEVHEWAERGLQRVTVSVNFSARQFELDTVSDLVANALRTTGLDAAQLELELTESLVLQDSDEVLAVLDDLRSLGVSCSIDDFGTGYSGLSYLTRFPIDRLKIDKSFVAQIGAGGREAGLVSAVIAMAHGLGLGVVAEGVETEEQASFLRAHGCDQMQGYLFGRPIPPKEFEELLRGHPAPTSREADAPCASVHVLAHRRR